MTRDNDMGERQRFGWERYETSSKAFICAEGTFRGEGEPTEEELCKQCVEETDNPQNE